MTADKTSCVIWSSLTLNNIAAVPMKLPIHLDIEEDTIWTEYRQEVQKISSVEELKTHAKRWGGLLTPGAICDKWFTDETLADIKSAEWKLDDQKIRDAAYYRWEQAGRPNDNGVHFWLEAEQELVAYTNMVYELIAPRKIVSAMMLAKEYVVPLNCAFIQANGGLGEFEDGC